MTTTGMNDYLGRHGHTHFSSEEMMTISESSRNTSAQTLSREDRQQYRDFVHVGPGTLAGRYLRTFWHPIYRSEDLAQGTAKPVRIMGEDLTLYRGQTGTPHLTGDRCRHRGAKLSIGWVEGDCIRCFYHGWMYNGKGECVEQPAEPKPFLEETPIKGYHAVDYLGVIFAYMGEGEPPPLPRYKNFEEENAFHMVQINYRGFNYFQDFENGMDRVHGGFVHRSRPRSFDGVTDSPLVRAEEDEWGLITFAQHPTSGRVGIQSFGMPNRQYTLDSFSDRENLIFKVPVDDENTVHFMITMARGEKAIEQEKKEQAIRATKQQLDAFTLAKEVVAGRLRHEDVDPMTVEMVFFEDDIVLLAQGVIADRATEFLGASDAPIVLLRRLWAREMRALAEGRPLKQWHYDPDVIKKKVKRV